MTPRELRFTVVGEPIPQGSMKSFVVTRKRDHKPIAVTTGDNPKTKGWRDTIAHCAALELQRAQHAGLFFDGSIEFEVWFYLPRPQALLTKTKAGKAIAHVKRPDVGKLARAAEDALSRVVWGDDCQITDLIARKRYVAAGEHPRAEIIVRDGPIPVESATRPRVPVRVSREGVYMARAAQAHDDPQNERGFTLREWTAAGYDPAQWSTAVSVLQGEPASPAIADLITRLRGPDGEELLARIKAHGLAPPVTGSQGGPTRHQLAHQLTYAKESKWFAAAAAIAANRDTPAAPGGEEEPMAKATKKAKRKSPDAPAPTRRGRPRQADLPGTEDRKIRALEDAAEAYAEIRDERMQLNLREAELKSALLAQMKKLGRTVYHRDGITITVVAEEETVKVRVKKPGDDDEDQDEAPPARGEEFAEERAAAVNAED